jgi:pimeloyl-ACP methyl ester carboxylesterase
MLNNCNSSRTTLVREVRDASRNPIRQKWRRPYRLSGHWNGPIDLVFVPGFISHVDHVWDEPRWAGFLERLASFSRLICFDKRGTGLSDRVSAIPTLEERMDDVRAVMDAVASERAALFGISEGGPMSLLFAATYPERTVALTLFGSYALFPTAVMSSERLAGFLMEVEESWGTGKFVPDFAPSLANDVAFRSWWARFERLGASPSAVKTLMRMNSEIDIRGVLPALHVPTLIMHRAGDGRVNVSAGRYLAQHIAGARYIELPGKDHLFCAGDSQRIIDEMEEFLTGSRSHFEMERALATVLFTDIVGSTERASFLGDRNWRHLLETHHACVRRELARFRGKEIKTLGDGFLATRSTVLPVASGARKLSATACVALVWTFDPDCILAKSKFCRMTWAELPYMSPRGLLNWRAQERF